MVTTSRWRHVGRLAIGTRSQDESPPSSAAVLGGDKHYLRAQESLRTMQWTGLVSIRAEDGLHLCDVPEYSPWDGAP